MQVTHACFLEEHGLCDSPALMLENCEGDEIIVEGFKREDMIQMFRNAFCACNAPSESELSALPLYVRKSLVEIADKLKSYECLGAD